MARRALSSPNTALSNENGHNGQETRGACPENKEEKLLQRISNTACFATKGREGGGGGGGGQAEGGGEAASGEAQFLRLFEARFGLAAPSPPVAAADGVAGSAAAPPPPPFHLAHVPEPSPPQGIPQASPPAARRSAVAAGGAAGVGRRD